MQCNFKPRNIKQLEEISEIFQALSHPKRLHIIELLANKPSCVTDIAHEMGCETPCTSQHLRILKNAGIVTSKRVSQKVEYSLVMKCIVQSISCISERIINGNQD